MLQMVKNLEIDGFLLSCVHVDFRQFLLKRYLQKLAQKLGPLTVCNNFWWREAKKTQTNRTLVYHDPLRLFKKNLGIICQQSTMGLEFLGIFYSSP